MFFDCGLVLYIVDYWLFGFIEESFGQFLGMRALNMVRGLCCFVWSILLVGCLYEALLKVCVLRF